MALPGMSPEYYKDQEFYSAWQQAMNPGQMPPMGGGNLSDPAFLAWKQQQGIPDQRPGLDPRRPQNIQQAQQMYGALGAARWANDQGQAVPPELQIAAFKEAGATGVPAAQMDEMFGMPAGTAAQFAQANQLSPLKEAQTGIAPTGPGAISTTYIDPVTGLPTHTPPAATGIAGTLGQRGALPPPPESDRAAIVAQQIAASEARSRRDYPNSQIPREAPTPRNPNTGIAGVKPSDADASLEPTGIAATTPAAATTPSNQLPQGGAYTGIGAAMGDGLPENIVPNIGTLPSIDPVTGAVTPAVEGGETLDARQYLANYPKLTEYYEANKEELIRDSGNPLFNSLEGYAQYHWDNFGKSEGRTFSPLPVVGGDDTTTGTIPLTVQQIIDKWKGGTGLTDTETRSLIDQAKTQNINTSTLANMIGVPVAELNAGLEKFGYGADYLGVNPATLTNVNPTVTTPSGATTTIQRESPEIEARKLGVIDLARDLASKEPAGGLPQAQVAGMSDLERQAYQQVADSSGVYQQAGQAGWETLQQGKQGLADIYTNRLPVADRGVQKYLEGYDPFVNAGVGSLNRAAGITNEVIQGSRPYLQSAGDTAGAATDFGLASYAEAIKGKNQAQGRADAAGNVGLSSAASAINKLKGSDASYNPYATQSYMNPYEQQVINAAMGDIRREGDKQLMSQRAQAVQAGAFGGSRAGIADADLNRQVLEQQAKTASNLRQQGYTQAQANSMAAFENARQRQQQGAQLTGSLGQQGAATSLQAAQMGQSGAMQGGQLGAQTASGARDTANTFSQLGTNYGQLGLQAADTFGKQAGLVGQLGESRANLGLRGVQAYGDTTKQGVQISDLARQYGINQAEMGRLGQDINIRDIAGLEQAGQAYRNENQRVLDTTRQNRLQDIYEPYQRIGFMSDVLRGAPSTQMQVSKTYEQQPSSASQVIGGIGSLASTYAGAKAANIV